MMPFELSLDSELDVEWQRFANAWLIKWHGMTYVGGVTDVEDFRGGRIHYSGIKFGYQQQQIFWQAISRYLNQKAHEVFKKWEVETQAYPVHIRKLSVDGTERSLKRFTAKIVSLSVDTDRRLRGAGFPQNVAAYDGSGMEARATAEVSQLAAAHRKLLDEQDVKAAVKPWYLTAGKFIEDLYANHKGLIWLIGIIGTGIIWLWRHFYG